jgi:Zn-dependent M28 family amino/carboxypeptidase
MSKMIFALFNFLREQDALVPLSGFLLAASLILGSAACSSAKPARSAEVAFPEIETSALLQHTQILSSDEYEGRAPGTKGEELTVTYITNQFQQAGLKPGNMDGSYIQKVPMVGITADPGANLAIRRGKKSLTLKFKDDFVPWTKQIAEDVELKDSELVFVGYGIQATEYSWDDYKGADLKGKIMVTLIGDPPIPDPNDPNELDPNMFKGQALTYYGRWTYKCEMAAKMGAAGVIIVHETKPAAYPFSVVQSSWLKEQLSLISSDNNAQRALMEAWITLDSAQRLCKFAGKDYNTLKKMALNRAFTPISFGATASVTLKTRTRNLESRNVVGKLTGSDPKLNDEYVLYTAHWDHLGAVHDASGDRIYHGAVDNATGVGGLIEIAQAYSKLQKPPRRSILFISVTGEEQGLLGSEYYSTHPIYPLSKTIAVINMDALNVYGKTKDITISGLGMSDLDDVARQVAKEQGRIVRADPFPEKGSYFRSDHFPFAKEGVPALASDSGIEYVNKPADYGKQVLERFAAENYHQPSDAVSPDWDLSGAVQDLQYYWMVGYRVAQADQVPQWKPGSEFQSKRAAQFKK